MFTLSLGIRLGLGLALGALVAYAAYRVHALSRGGAVAAAFEGMLIFGFGGWVGAALLLAFFISSSLLSRAFKQRKVRFEEKFSKGAQRDAGQVLANGGVAALFMLFHGLFPAQMWPWAGFVASLAAVNADTWATELGVLNRSAPHLITTGRPVEPGSSGAVSPTGLCAAVGGAAFVALLALLLLPFSGSFLREPQLAWFAFFAILTFSGLFGSLVDSLLGATFQAIYVCPTCHKETERSPLHTCGTPTQWKRGWKWLNNDWVNVACALSGAAFALCIGWLSPGLSAALQPADFSSQGGNLMTFPISSTSFEEGKTIPAVYTCSGENRSPQLAWRDLPTGTRSLALIVEDPDAPLGTFIHWVLYNLPPTQTALPEGDSGAGTPGYNSYRHLAYDGPCPPPGAAHRYYFRLFALDSEPTLPAHLTADQLRKTMQGHILGEASWMGKYSR